MTRFDSENKGPNWLPVKDNRGARAHARYDSNAVEI